MPLGWRLLGTVVRVCFKAQSSRLQPQIRVGELRLELENIVMKGLSFHDFHTAAAYHFVTLSISLSHFSNKSPAWMGLREDGTET